MRNGVIRVVVSVILAFSLLVPMLVTSTPVVAQELPPTPTNPRPGSTTAPGPVLSSSTVTLEWDASSGATRYALGVRNRNTGVLEVDTWVYSSSHTVTLNPNTPYQWNVAAWNEAGYSPFTTLRYFQIPIDGSPPATPTNPRPGSTTAPGPVLSSRTVTLEWDASSGATRYALGVRNRNTGVLEVDTWVYSSSHTVTLNPNTPYQWNVAAWNEAGYSPFTTLRYFQIPIDGSPPATPTNPRPGSTTAPGPLLTSRTVTLEWDASSGTIYYMLWVHNVNTDSIEVVGMATSTSYTVTLQPDTPYWWVVKAYNSAGSSPLTTPLYFQTSPAKADLVLDMYPVYDAVWGGISFNHMYVTNAGDITADNVRLVLMLDDAVECWGASEDWTYDYGDHSVTLDLGSIGVGSGCSIWIELYYEPYYMEVGFVEIYGSVSTTTLEYDYLNNEAQQGYLIFPVDQFLLFKDAPASVGQGSEITYSIEYWNLIRGLWWDGMTENVVLVDTLPAEVEFISASNDGIYADSQVTWELGSSTDLEDGEVTVTVKVADDAPIGTTIYNQAEIWGSEGIPSAPYSYANVVTTVQASGNQRPIASAESLGGQRKIICADTQYTVAAAYHDLDGMEDLKYCYLRLNHPTKPLTLMWNQATDEYSAWAGEEGANYVTVTGYTVPMYDTGYDLNWQFTINDAWPEVEDCIDFGVFAMDDQGAVSGWEYDDSNASFMIDTPLEVYAYEDESSRSWTRDSTTDLPICNSLLMYEITNIGNRVATNIDVNIEIDGTSFTQDTIPSLDEGVTYMTVCTLPINYDSSSHVKITASTACRSDTYSLVVDASLPRTRLDDLTKLFVTPNDTVVKNTLEIILSSYPSIFPDWVAIRDWVGFTVAYAWDKDEYGVADYFKLPRETIQDARGDCEDFAILLVSLLRANGWDPDEVYVVVGKNPQNEYHAWVILNIDVLGWHTIEPQFDALGTFVGDYLALKDYEAVYVFNDEQFMEPCVIKALSPVDILVTDPDGLVLSKQLSEIPGAWYSEIDLDSDGDLDDQLVLPQRKIGDYTVMIVPEVDSLPTDTYTLQVSFNGTIVTLAEDASISNIPDQGYIVRSTETELIQIIPAMIDFDPDVLNLATKGKYVTAYIELPPGYDVGQIDISSIRLNGTVPALGKPTEVGDYDNDGIPDLMVKFHRTMVQDALTVGDEVEVTITGEIDGITFIGSDYIRVI